MTDADVDGAHIRTLLLTFFYRHMPAVINEGHLFIAQPPLYLVQQGKKKFYAYGEDEREAIIDRLIAERTGKAAPVEEPEGSGAPENAVEPDAAVAGESEEDAPVADEEKERRKAAGVTGIQRYKGLGEMNADQLWDTTMDPENRVLLKVTVQDAEKADAIFNKLMGEEVLLRKNFINSNATAVSDADLDI
jgi:DNA gyrase subunit B